MSLIGSSVIDDLLKHWIARPRPELVPHLVQVTNASFPSGHAMISSAIYLTLALMLAEGIEADGWRARISGRPGRAGLGGGRGANEPVGSARESFMRCAAAAARHATRYSQGYWPA